MAWLVLALSAALATLAVLVASGVAGAPGLRGSDSLAARVSRMASRPVARLSRTVLVGRLTEFPPMGRLADALCAAARSRSSGVPAFIHCREDGCAALVLIAAFVSFAAGLVFCSLAASLLALCLFGVAVLLWDGASARRRARELSAEMPGVFRTLAMALGSGETLSQAIEYVGRHEGGRAGQAFLRASMRLRCGMSAEESLAALADELKAPGVGLLVSALLISQRTGSPLRELFQGSAALVERQGEFERLLEVKTAQVRLSVRVVSLLPAVLVGLLSLISPDYLQGVATPSGMACLALAALMDGVALLIIRALMKGVIA